MKLTPFQSVVDQYETIFFDAFGVLRNNEGLLPGIEDTFAYLEDRDIPYFILTNDASKSPYDIAEAYQEKGLRSITMQKIISSGMLAGQYLKKEVKTGTIAYLGTPQSAHYLELLGLDVLSVAQLKLSQANEISALVFLNDEGFDWSREINKVINLLRSTNIPVIVSNTDRLYPTSGNQVAVAIGAIASMIESIIEKRFIRFGKPDTQLFTFAYEHAIKKGGTPDKNKILMVGDTLSTDILGGNRFGVDTALVLTGNTMRRYVDTMVDKSGILPTYVCDSAVVDHRHVDFFRSVTTAEA